MKAIGKMTRTEVKPISVSNANATWEHASNKVNYYETSVQEETKKVHTQTVKEKYSFVTEWTVHNNEVVKPAYEYKNKDEFIVEW
ncbi:MAG: hypothetical protein LUH63_12950 [Parabacteroides sp.]|nr:hypothetical protein [Parabacteroides sp.]